MSAINARTLQIVALATYDLAMTDGKDDSMGENGALFRVFRRLREAFSAPDATLPVDSPEPVALDVRRQVAALCHRGLGEDTQVLLVTSRDTGRWILPKGWIEANEDAHEAAGREAWEEAGVEGTASDTPLGTYVYRKALSGGDSVVCQVEVFALEVSRVAKDWPERKQRDRRWYSARKAAKLVAEPELRDLLRRFDDSRRAAA